MAKTGTPGSGRYTTYVPVDQNSGTVDRYKRRLAMFNARSSGGDVGLIYKGDDLATVAKNVSANAQNYFGDVDPLMFPDGVTLDYSGAPDINSVKWTNAGDPANPYVPDITSPGAGKTDPLQKDANPDLTVDKFKRNSSTDDAIKSPSATSNSSNLGSLPIGVTLTQGKSGPTKA
jgi:hypothetical protein